MPPQGKRRLQILGIARLNWWQYEKKRPALYHALGRGHLFINHPRDWDGNTPALRTVLAISTGTTKYPAFTFLQGNLIYSNKLCVLADDRFAMFAVLSSDIHAVWAWKYKTTLQADMESMRYAHGNIFETFPFPRDFFLLGNATLDELGRLFLRLARRSCRSMR